MIEGSVHYGVRSLQLSELVDERRRMAHNTTVLAPNGQTYTFHSSSRFRGYVYALGHRVYGTRSALVDGVTPTFTPRGKWAFILAAASADEQVSV